MSAYTSENKSCILGQRSEQEEGSYLQTLQVGVDVLDVVRAELRLRDVLLIHVRHRQQRLGESPAQFPLHLQGRILWESRERLRDSGRSLWDPFGVLGAGRLGGLLG